MNCSPSCGAWSCCACGNTARVPAVSVLLFAGARESVVWYFWCPDAITTVDIMIDGEWNAATVDGSMATLLLAGPDAEDNPDGTVVLEVGTHDTLVRLNDGDQLIVRAGGRITVR